MSDVAVATLDIALADDGEHLAYQFGCEDMSHRFNGPSLTQVFALTQKLNELYADSEQRVRMLRHLPESFIPSRLTGTISEWTGRNGDSAVLAVRLGKGVSLGVPWPEILREQRLAPPSVLTVHIGAGAGARPPAPSPVAGRVLVAGWGRSGTSSLPGIDRELTELGKLLSKSSIQTSVLSDPDRDALFASLLIQKPSVLHLSLWGLVRREEEVTLPVEPGVPGGADFDLIDLNAFAQNVTSANSVKLLVINACHSAYPWALELASRLDAATIGWGGLVEDDVAADFALYVYHRLLEGLSVAEALRSFLRTSTPWASSVVNSLPVLCFPNDQWLDWRPIATAISREQILLTESQSPGSVATAQHPNIEQSTPPTAAVKVSPAGATSRDTEGPWLKIDFRPRKSINPAMLINREAPIEHIDIESPIKQQIRLRIVCDTGRGTSCYEETHDLNVGSYPSMHMNVFFPVLHELAEKSAKRRRIVFTLTADSPGASTPPILITKTADWMGATEWLDAPDTWRYVPAFANPHDPCIATLIGSAVEVLRTIGDPNDDFDGYQSSAKKPEHPERQVQAIFQTLRDARYGIRYASPPGGVLSDRGRYTGQVVRTHSQVIRHRLGTCHDLTLLMAAATEHVGLYPLIIILQNHTFFGFWLSASAQYAFWKAQKPVDSALSGSISSGEKLRQLASSGHVVLLDAVAICRPFFSYEKAKTEGASYLTKALENPLFGFSVALDVIQIRGTGINPI